MARREYGVTGHRDFGPKEASEEVIRRAYSWVENHPGHYHLGGCWGFDLWVNEIVILLGYPYSLWLPFPAHIFASKWKPQHQEGLRKALYKAQSIDIVSPVFSKASYRTRNIRLVGASDEILACWTGEPGGTGMTVGLAEQQKKIIHNIWPPSAQIP